MKGKLAIVLITVSLFLLSLACSDGGGDTTTTTTTTATVTVTVTVDEACWQRAYNECIDVGNDVWTCNDFAKEACGDN